ncbi:MAG: hypothetical protein M3T49_06735 [Candidatus Eremiobacteraeota bacterium]|nr:hypothetical protein [Candidatus Eremiobacteraeota bacterium]
MRMIKTILIASFLWCAPALPAVADPFVPSAGHGTLNVYLSNIYADRAFSQTFGAATAPSHTSVLEHRLQLTGERGLSRRWALHFDLRIATITKIKKHLTTTATGLEDQQIAIVRRLGTDPTFAQAVALNIVLPTGAHSAPGPNLGDGQFALEPQYQVVKRGKNASYTVLTVGPRFYTGDGGTQLRADGALGRRLSRALSGKLTLFYSTTLGAKHSTTVLEHNVFRAGIWIRANGHRVRPEIGYERDLAGSSRLAQQRLNFAVDVRY